MIKKFTVSALLLGVTSVWAQQADQTSTYILNGNTNGAWQAAIGNALNWNIPVIDSSAQTERGNLTVSSSTRTVDNDAIRLIWKGRIVKNEWDGNSLGDSFYSISKHKVDISSVVDVAALAIDLKINRAPTEKTSIKLQCNYSNKCLAEFDVKHVLKKMPTDTWTQLPIPLNCFNQDGNFDFANLTQPFSISTQGKLDIEIANVTLVALAPGDQGCKK